MPAAPSFDPSLLPSSDPNLSLVDATLRLSLCGDDMVLVEFLIAPALGKSEASTSASAANRSVRARWGSEDFQEIVKTESKEGVEMANLLGFLGLGK
jgi:hypothetical protein